MVVYLYTAPAPIVVALALAAQTGCTEMRASRSPEAAPQALNRGPTIAGDPTVIDVRSAEASQRVGTAPPPMPVQGGRDDRAVSDAGGMGLAQIRRPNQHDLDGAFPLRADAVHAERDLLAGATKVYANANRSGGLGQVAGPHSRPGRDAEQRAIGRALPNETAVSVAPLEPFSVSCFAAQSHAGGRATKPDWQAAPLFVARPKPRVGSGFDVESRAPDRPSSSTPNAFSPQPADPSNGLLGPSSAETSR